ncbi:hypothetical protein K431DRAFT_279461 [Polychaeton citri CBS 116435]|uniref:Ribosomal protein bL31m N-terminal domain-containing protein n=1 Tax=Polychaeton citri CBS 116435 TaxID=1314669 RepID=A0A9P4Q0E9_9PEZI|nr:hypothetical protein K431DRAFT_279461 [Polychaeton citri CBS 116435]
MLARSSARPVCRHCHIRQQTRHASLIRRPKRPYTFTQLIQLSDGSTFTQRTTSPLPIYRTTKDTKNNPLWNPSSQKLLNVESDEAGRLKKFRGRFGRGFDSEAAAGQEEAVNSVAEEDESLMDLISASAQEAAKNGNAAGSAEPAVKSGKGKGGQK